MKKLILSALLACGTAGNTFAQLSLPPNGNNQKAEVSQYVGLVKIQVSYSSPNVTSPEGADRTGKIWGELVHHGYADLGFGTSKNAPWRAGANENTTFETSHDILVEGKNLPAGKYGFFVATAKDKPWTVIFSKNSSSWGSYYYSQNEDALRVDITPQANDFRQWLTYEFTERKPTETTLALMWEKIKLPIKITVPNLNEYYVATLRNELRGAAGESSENWANAAMFCVQNKMNLDEALTWADMAITANYIGKRNYTTLVAKAQVLNALGRKDESEKLMKEAVMHPTATAMDIHQYGRMLLGAGKKNEALEIFKHNAEKNKSEWVVHIGLIRGYSAVGNYKKALECAENAQKVVTEETNKKNVTRMIELLKQGKDVNSN
jgi:tetratricopeptide (TPR) repeat protein